MAFCYVEYERLKTSIKQAIVDLINSHKSDCRADVDFLTDQVKVLPDERRSQAEFLLKAIEILDRTESEQNSLILNAAAYFVFSKIKATYTESYVGLFVSAVRSKLYTGLKLALKIDDANTPTDENLIEMYGTLETFLSNHTYVEGNPRRGYLPSPAFSKVHAYKVEDEIKSLKALKTEKETAGVDAAEDLKLRASTTSLLT